MADTEPLCAICWDLNQDNPSYRLNPNDGAGRRICKECAVRSVVPAFETALKNEFEYPPRK